jgi:hypothetical protein
MRKIRFERSTKPSKQEKAAQGKSGFVPAVARWVIERSNAWMERCKSLVKNFEHRVSHRYGGGVNVLAPKPPKHH